MKILITICARGGSKGIPGKNIRPLNNVPLIAYTINAARQFGEHFDTTIAVSTDDEDIKQVAANYGLQTNYNRPAELATDTAGKIDTILDLVKFQEKEGQTTYDYILDLDVTSPLRTSEDLLLAFDLLRNDEQAINLFSVNPAARNPYFNMVEQKEDGYYQPSKSGGAVLTRQTAPKVYDLNASFYFYKRAFFNSGLKTIYTPASLIYVMPHICFDLDHLIDFEFLDFLLSNNKLGFTI